MKKSFPIFTTLFGKLPKPYALPMKGFNHEPNAYCWEDWQKEHRLAYPFRYWLWETMPLWFIINITLPIKNAWYWVKTHTYKKYHLLDLRSDVGIKYSYGWLENDTAMMIACFNILRSFVEIENGLKSLSWNFQEEDWWKTITNKEQEIYFNQRADFQAIAELYDWWMVCRNKEHESIKNMYSNRHDDIDTFSDGRLMKYYQALDELDKKDDEKLKKLIEYRHYLWT